MVSILKPCVSIHKNSLIVRLHKVSPSDISKKDEVAILEQVRRMLRISHKDEENVKEYHTKLFQLKDKDNDDHYKVGSGRMFRSPSLFEDLVKCLLLCNCKWSNSLKMAQALCELQFEPSSNASMRSNGQKRQREELKIDRSDSDGKEKLGNFPSSRELARLDGKTLKKLTNNILGYRAKYILSLAKGVESGKIRLAEFEGLEEKDDVFQKFMQIKGFGSFACANAMMCIGYYHKVPVDTETIRHLQQVHGRKNCNKNTVMEDVEEIYKKYAPFQCLAYWSELLDSYECKFGKLSELPDSAYHTISGRLETFDTI
ncbi:uncharacterized protein LOC133723285 [Rosa rugosa]|uniref:uncharacterized protein LOC133723285 n=1 Tax=Rosa rugosa TaxID=74645 RepID=UPI002B4130EF|nr:uncharacterized protein LOC133723285 [Rosa rugosa]